MEFDLGKLSEKVISAKNDLSVEVGSLAKTAQKRAILIAVEGLYRVGVLDWFGQQVKERLPKITQVSWSSPQAAQKFLKLTAEGFLPQIYAGHFVHLDANFMAEAFAFLQEAARANGFAGRLRQGVEPIAITVANGKQDRFMEIMYPYMEAHAARRNVTFFKTTREKDVEVYDETKERGEADAFLSFLNEEGKASLLLPYGSIQAGRHLPGTERGSIDGLKQLYNPRDGKPIENLVKVFRIMEYKGRAYRQKPYLQPVSLRRSYRAQSPDSYLPTPEGIISLYDEPSNFLRHFGFRRLVVEAILGMPITKEDIRSEIGSDWKRRVEDVNRFLMERVAMNQLPSERGQFSYVDRETGVTV